MSLGEDGKNLALSYNLSQHDADKKDQALEYENEMNSGLFLL